MSKRQDTFRYAIEGVLFVFKTQRNMKVHGVVAVLMLLLGFVVGLEVIEFILLSLTIALVLVAESINTALEKTVDLFTAEYHPLAKAAKNVAAGSVFISALAAVIIGVLLFSPALIGAIIEYEDIFSNYAPWLSMISGGVVLLLLLSGYKHNRYSGFSISVGTTVLGLLFLVNPTLSLGVFSAVVITFLAALHVYNKKGSSTEVLCQLATGVFLAIMLWFGRMIVY